MKIFLGISKGEQLRRFRDRIQDPYKAWKLTEADLQARSQWNLYVAAVDDMFEKTSTTHAPWHLVPANDKAFARQQVLKIVTSALEEHRHFIETGAKAHRKTMEDELRQLEKRAR